MASIMYDTQLIGEEEVDIDVINPTPYIFKDDFFDISNARTYHRVNQNQKDRDLCTT